MEAGVQSGVLLIGENGRLFLKRISLALISISYNKIRLNIIALTLIVLVKIQEAVAQSQNNSC